jgi:hypothetical protein
MAKPIRWSAPIVSEDHPLANYDPPQGADCIADIPTEILNQLVLYYEGEEPLGEPIPDDVELV